MVADVKESGILFPDPAPRVYIRQETLDANPGRPGAPISIPGIPIETASGGIKAPQYFAPGVAGDHGEPIAQYIQVGSYLVSNNLSANAHGDGYADPNIMIPATLEGVQTDSGAFNVREGNHAEDLSPIYVLRPRFEPFVTVTWHAAIFRLGYCRHRFRKRMPAISIAVCPLPKRHAPDSADPSQ